MKKQSKIQVLVFRDTNSGEADEVYRLDKKGEGDRFFWNILNNTEKNQVHHIRLEEWTKEQWRLAELAGRAFAGDINKKQEKEYSTLIKKVGKHDKTVWPS